MDRAKTQLEFEISEQLFEQKCAISERRLQILCESFIKLCENLPNMKELFQDEINELEELNIREDEVESELNNLL